MPRVKMLTSVATAAYSRDFDTEYDLHPDEAQEWVRNGFAEYVRDEIEIPESRRVAPEIRRGPGRPRKNP